MVEGEREEGWRADRAQQSERSDNTAREVADYIPPAVWRHKYVIILRPKHEACAQGVDKRLLVRNVVVVFAHFSHGTQEQSVGLDAAPRWAAGTFAASK